jgi:hypothetical protein
MVESALITNIGPFAIFSTGSFDLNFLPSSADKISWRLLKEMRVGVSG